MNTYTLNKKEIIEINWTHNGIKICFGEFEPYMTYLGTDEYKHKHIKQADTNVSKKK